jgi:hypothetical protein
MRKEAGDHDGAERLVREAIDAGHTIALTVLVAMRKQAGDGDGNERLGALLRRGLDADDVPPVNDFG